MKIPKTTYPGLELLANEWLEQWPDHVEEERLIDHMHLFQAQRHSFLDECQQTPWEGRRQAANLLHAQPIEVHDDDNAARLGVRLTCGRQMHQIEDSEQLVGWHLLGIPACWRYTWISQGTNVKTVSTYIHSWRARRDDHLGRDLWVHWRCCVPWMTCVRHRASDLSAVMSSPSWIQPLCASKLHVIRQIRRKMFTQKTKNKKHLFNSQSIKIKGTRSYVALHC